MSSPSPALSLIYLISEAGIIHEKHQQPINFQYHQRIEVKPFSQ